MLRSIALCAALLVLATPLRAEIVHVDSAGLERLLAEDVAVVDIRTPEEWRRTGTIEGSHLLTFFDADGDHDIDAWLRTLDGVAGAGQPVALLLYGDFLSNGSMARPRPVGQRRSRASDPRGTLLRAPLRRRTLVFGWVACDPDHDAVIRIGSRVPGRQAHSVGRHESQEQERVAPPRTDHGRTGKALRSGPRPRGTQAVGLRATPSGTSPWVTKRHKAISSLRASATIMVLRSSRRPPAVRS